MKHHRRYVVSVFRAITLGLALLVLYVPSAALGENKRFPPVIVYLTDWCPYCQRAEQFLKSHSVPYERVNIEKSKAGQAEYKKLGGGGVPVLKIGSEVIRGFQSSVISQALGLDKK